MPTTCRTERLTLRPLVAADAPAVFAFAGDREVTRLMDWEMHVDLADSEAFIEDVTAGWDDGDDYCWGIELYDEARIIGTIACQFDEHGMQMGYVVAKDHWRRGFATEAARAVLDAARDIDDVYRFSATCDVENTASVRVLEKIGMRCEGVLARWSERPNIDDSRIPRDVYMYAWTR
ncbi:GNAT family N-acetyltransferase [Salinisphaera aquimarina]|uniref:GNAT family N-acetyltransferase n=1 Tax=Salinisphaera aquimarina TaxID=2094031 RepID=A0ABV7EWE6_9GAMM